MNIFWLHPHPGINAQYYNDRLCSKIILETAQMMCTAVNEHGGNTPYRSTHINHPMNKWVRSSQDAWHTAYRIAEALNKEYMYRFEKQQPHKSFTVIQEMRDEQMFNVLPEKRLRTPPMTVPDQYKTQNLYRSYRKYYRAEKMQWNDRDARFTKRPTPAWATRGENM